MPIATQVKLLRSLREILLGNGLHIFPPGNDPKPDFISTHSVPLPRSTPEEQGLSSAMLDSFYKDIANSRGSYAHSLLVLRNGSVVCEGYFSPYRKDIWHVAHSLSKTFTGTAVGIAIHEGLFKLDDAVADYFPDKIGLLTPKRLRQITVRQLLTMSSGITFNELSEAVEKDWIKGIFSSNTAFEPGSQFVYNSMNSYLLAALVQKTSGKGLIEYLTPRLLQPLGFGSFGWEKCPSGYEKGGWGMYITVEDMAKFGQLYLQKGVWQVDGENQQIIPQEWVEQATSKQIEGPNGEAYGYQIWADQNTPNFIMSGMFGQYITVLPEQNMVLAMTAGCPNLFIDSISYTIMQNYYQDKLFSQTALPPNPVANHRLHRTLGQLRYQQPLPKPERIVKPFPAANRRDIWNHTRTARTPSIPQETALFCNRTWQFVHNRGCILPLIVQFMNNNFTNGIKALYLEQEQDHLALYWEEEGGTIYLPVGFNAPLERKIGVGKESFLVATSAALRNNEDCEPVLIIEMCLLEHSSTRIMKLTRKGENIILRLDEQPQLMLAAESVFKQDALTSSISEEAGQSIGDRLLNSNYTNYRLAQLCTPELEGKLVPPPPP